MRFTEAQVDALIRRDRQTHGLPETIEDEEPFRQIAALLDADSETVTVKRRVT